MYFEFIPHVQGRPSLSHMHKRCVTHPHRCICIGESWSSFHTHILVEVISSLLDGDGAAFLVMCLGLLGAVSWWSILDETSWGLCDTCGKLKL